MVYSVWMTVNRSCNLRCKWCYAQSAGFSKEKSMDMLVFNNLLEMIDDGIDIKKIILIGGEPTLHVDFFKILQQIQQKNINTTLITNGIKFANLDFTKKAKSYGLSKVTLSLKAPNNKLYKEWTGQAVMKSVQKAIENLQNSDIVLTVSLVLSPILYPYIEELVHVLKEMGVQRVYMDTERPVLVASKAVYEKSIQDVVEGCWRTVNAFEKEGLHYIFKISLPFCLMPQDFIKKLKTEKHLQSGCQMLKESGLVFDTNGDLLACSQLFNASLGRYKKDFYSNETLKKFLLSSQCKKFYERVTSYPHLKCQNCSDWIYCGGGCRINWFYKNLLD